MTNLTRAWTVSPVVVFAQISYDNGKDTDRKNGNRNKTDADANNIMTTILSNAVRFLNNNDNANGNDCNLDNNDNDNDKQLYLS